MLRKYNKIVFAPDDPGTDPDPGVQTGNQPDFSKLESALEGLPRAVQDAVMGGLREFAQEQQDNRAVAPKNPDPEPDPEPEPDLESMSRKELIAYMEKKFGSTVEKALKPLKDNVDSTSAEAQRERINRQVNEAAQKHADFWEWTDEMRGKAKTHPSLSVEELYTLVRHENPEKAKQIDTKMAEKEADKKKETQPETPRFGGLTPTSGTKTQKTEKMDSKTAAQAAWDEVMSQVPKEFIGE